MRPIMRLREERDDVKVILVVTNMHLLSSYGNSYKEIEAVGKILSILDFLLRGNGTAIDQYCLSKKGIRREFLGDINRNNNDWVHKLFNFSFDITMKAIKNEPVRLIARIWELHYLINKLEKIHTIGSNHHDN